MQADGPPKLLLQIPRINYSRIFQDDDWILKPRVRDTMLFVSGRLDDAMGGRRVDTANGSNRVAAGVFMDWWIGKICQGFFVPLIFLLRINATNDVHGRVFRNRRSLRSTHHLCSSRPAL